MPAKWCKTLKAQILRQYFAWFHKFWYNLFSNALFYCYGLLQQIGKTTLTDENHLPSRNISICQHASKICGQLPQYSDVHPICNKFKQPTFLTVVEELILIKLLSCLEMQFNYTASIINCLILRNITFLDEKMFHLVF